MNLTSIQIFKNASVSVWQPLVTLGLTGLSPSQSYIIKGATGLDAEEIIPKFVGFRRTYGGKFYEMGLEERIITFKIGLNPQYGVGETISSLRDNLYKAIDAYKASELQIRFMDGTNIVCVIGGYITKFETDHFSNNTDITLTIVCTNPYLKSLNRVVVDTSGVSKNLPIITDSVSTASHGFRAEFKFTALTNGFEFSNINRDWIFDINYQFQVNDVLYIRSETGDRDCFVIRGFDSVVVQLMDLLDSDSTWPIIHPGANSFITSSIDYNFQYFAYYNTFWGV